VGDELKARIEHSISASYPKADFGRGGLLHIRYLPD
jgi:hypothetical protein